MIACAHPGTRVIGAPRPYMGQVASWEGNRAAHGYIEVTEECAACGARRRTLRNGPHREYGTWGPSRAQRADAARRAAERARALRSSHAGRAISLSCGERTARIEIDPEGYLVVVGDQAAVRSDAAQPIVDAARRLRQAVLDAQACEGGE